MIFENLRLYDILRQDLHLPDNRAMEAMVAMDDFFSQKVANAHRDLPTKAEVATKDELKAEISAVNLRLDHMTETMATKDEMNAKFDHMTATMATKAELNQVNLNLTEEIYKVETRLTRTIFSASLAQLLVIMISIFSILKYTGVIK